MRRLVAPQLCRGDFHLGAHPLAERNGQGAVHDRVAQLPLSRAVHFDDGRRMGERLDAQGVRRDMRFFADVQPHIAVDAAALVPARVVVIGRIDGHSHLVLPRMEERVDALADGDIAVDEGADLCAVDENFAAAVDALKFKVNCLARPLLRQTETFAVLVLAAVIEGAEIPDADGRIARLRDRSIVRQVDALRFAA